MNADSKQTIETTVIEAGNDSFHLPLATKFLPNSNGDKDMSLAVIVTLPEKKKSNKGENYDFQKDVVDNIPEFEIALRYFLTTKFGKHRIAPLEVAKYKADDVKSIQEPNKIRQSPKLYRNPPKSAAEKKGTYCKFKDECKNGAGCPYAHAKAELFCSICKKQGDHPTSKCPSAKPGSWRKKSAGQ